MSAFLNKPRGAKRRNVPRTDASRQKYSMFLKKILFSLLVMLVLAGLAVNSRHIYEEVNSQRVEMVAIEGELSFVTELEVQRAVYRFIDQSFLSLPLEELKVSLETQPWIREVSIRRQWPNTLVINVSEEIAIARWGREQLLNQQGEVFSPGNAFEQVHLPMLYGPQGSERRVMEQYQLFNQLLFPHGLRIANLNLNSRGAWSLGLLNGVQINIGRDRALDRLRRFVSLLDPVFIEQMAMIESFDLRYNNGIAVRKREFSREEIASL